MALLTLARVYHATGDTDMSSEIGARLLRFWKDADPDYEPLHELKALLRTGMPARTSGV